MSEAGDRANEAHDQRYKHGKAARTWDAVGDEHGDRAPVCRILARWMYAYEEADAAAQKAFMDLAAGLGDEETEK